MAKIGIIGAMSSEVREFCTEFCAEIPEAGKVSKGMSGKHEVYICESGIGKVNAAITAQKMIDLYGVEYLINSGVAGCLSKELKVCDAVIAESLTYHDFDPIDILDRNFPFTSSFKADEGLVKSALDVCGRLSDGGKLFGYKKGVVVSGDCFVNDTAKANSLRENLGALCTEMEGAAIAHVAYASNIPFAVIRTMSDFADDNADMSFDEFEKIAAKRAAEIVSGMIEKL